jgi:LysM repeat protein
MLRRSNSALSVPCRPARIAAAALVAGLAFTALAAPTVSAAPASKPTQRVAAEYVVKDGDYLFGIARKLGVPVADLLSANGLTLTSALHPGQRLAVPANATNPTAGTAAAPAAAPATYTVKSGDYLFGIARTLGVSLTSLLSTNNLKVTSAVHPGQQLIVPAGATNPTGGDTPASPTAAPAAPATSGLTYTVQRGDSWFSIAQKHGIKAGPLVKLNGRTIESVVFPGTVLQLPAGAVASGVSPAPTSTDAGPSTPTTSSKIDTIVAYAKAQLGKPYKFNTAGPDYFDCSGLTAAAYKQVGLWLPHQSAMQSTRGVAVDWRTEDIQAGDLVFMFSSDNPTVISHVGIAINSWQWVHAPRAGDVVRQGLIPRDDVIQAVRRYITD